MTNGRPFTNFPVWVGGSADGEVGGEREVAAENFIGV